MKFGRKTNLSSVCWEIESLRRGIISGAHTGRIPRNADQYY